MKEQSRLSKTFCGGFLFFLGPIFIFAAIFLEPGSSVSDGLRIAWPYVCWITGLLFSLAGGKLLYDAKHAAVLLIFGCIFCLLGLWFILALPPKGLYLIEKMDSGVALFVTVASLLFPLLGLWFLMTKHGERLQLLSGFAVSLIPAVCILWIFLSARLAPLPYHVSENGTKHVVAGMTGAQVVQALGLPRGGGLSWHDKHDKNRLTYDLQVAWGFSGRQFFVDLVDDHVVSAKIVRYGGEVDDEFFQSDFLKELKTGKALQVEPASAGNKSQPFSLETNQTPSATGSRR